MAETALERALTLVRAARKLDGEAQARALASLEAALEEAGAQAAHGQHGAGGGDEVLVEIDPAGYLTGWNRGAAAMFGYTAAEALGQHVLFLYCADDEDAEIAELFPSQRGGLIEVRRRKKNGETIWLRLAPGAADDADGHACGMLVRMTPVGALLDGDAKQRLHARIIEDSEQGVLITDHLERIVSVNSAFTRITGYSQSESIGRTPDLLRSGAHDAEFRGRVRAAMRGHGTWRGEIIGRRKNGELFPQSVTVSVVRDPNGVITNTFSLFSDISVHKDAEARMQRMANYDSLTGLPNRALFNHLFGQVLAASRRNNDRGALLVLDASRIGAISDTLGHDIANELIVTVGVMLRMALRDADILARIDGCKYAIGLQGVATREQAGLVARKLLDLLAAPITLGSHCLRVSADVGIATYPEDSIDTAALMHCAEMALARASDSGAGILFYREEMDLSAREHMLLETELRQALAGQQLELHYQPKVSLRNGRIVGAEALIRWRHPLRGMIRPDVFIALAEESGLIVEIGDWVLDEACRQVRQWMDEGLTMPPIAVNLSARQFDAGLPARVQAVLDRHGVRPEQIMLEITESLLVRGADSVIAIMNQLVAMGMALALDDFGTGYSSLAYLKKFPISVLKIDRSFVTGLPFDEHDCAIARAIVTMARQLRQEIVAEGVETREQMTFLRELGCDQLQGYLFSPATRASEFALMQHEGRRLMVTAEVG
ncbi:putative bifunctional diguanylate cyclase/phosphodiesterase [Massilia glaciei]|uniref:Phosphodiesterase n=1 Tax=Massilia glaciei TaxID=1524097 RepID=A0A2U2I5P6_9BURK|nr:EAL domain-containing protein [Massilia glaciei]PWF55080.1 phosphodiesterase [Massilia glaciei]